MNRSLLFLLAMLLLPGHVNAQDPAGYVWPLSAAPGETIELFVSGVLIPEDPLQPNVTFHRVTSNSAGVLVTEPDPTAGVSIPSVIQDVDSPEPWRDGAQWLPNTTFTIPPDWPTGFYVATLKAQSGVDFHITFTVKPAPAARHRTALLANVNTWNAYNNWGGRSKYSDAAVTSFMRPNPGAGLAIGVSPTDPLLPFGAKHLAHAEVWLLAAIEDYLGRGNVDVYSDIDFHTGAVQAGRRPGQYDRLILSTHPEYWSTQMYDNLRAFLDQGGSVLYLGGNGIFETAVYSTSAGGAALTFLKGVEGAQGDPNPEPSLRTPALFRVVDQVDDVPPRAERALLGVATTSCGSPGDGQPYVVKPHPPAGTYERRIFDALLAGVVGPSDSGREIGSVGVLGAGASGHEVDRVAAIVDADGYVTNQPGASCAIQPPIYERDTTPDGVVQLAEGGPFKVTTSSGTVFERGADMIYYRYPNPPGANHGSGFVFSVGSVNFGQSLLVDEKLRTLLGNVLCPGRPPGRQPLESCRTTSDFAR